MGLTLKQCAEKAGIVESTARFYRERYIEYMNFTGVGRNREYAETTADVFKAIAKYHGEGLTHNQVKEALDGLFGVPVQDMAAPHDLDSNATATQQNDLLAKILQELAWRDETISRLEQKLDELIDSSALRDAAMERIEYKTDEAIQRIEHKTDEVMRSTSELARGTEERDRELVESIRSIQMATQRQRSMPWWQRLLGK